MALLQVANFEIFAAGNVRRHRRRPRDLEKSERQLARAHTVKHKIPIRGHKKNARFYSKWKQKVIHKCKPNEPLYYFLQRSKQDLIFPFQSYIIDKHQTTLLYVADNILHVKMPFFAIFFKFGIPAFCTLDSFHFAMLHENAELTKIKYRIFF